MKAPCDKEQSKEKERVLSQRRWKDLIIYEEGVTMEACFKQRRRQVSDIKRACAIGTQEKHSPDGGGTICTVHVQSEYKHSKGGGT
eukprot:scaffold44725_cov19-Tisochrysis_lutea.AAC.4